MVMHTYSHLHKYALRCKNFLLRLRENIPTLGKNYSPVREKSNPAPDDVTARQALHHAQIFRAEDCMKNKSHQGGDF